MTSESEDQLKEDFKTGRITKGDIQVIKRRITEVEEDGLKFAQENRTWRDHELDGPWQGHRSISFSVSGRVIYRLENKAVIVRVSG